MDISDLQSVKLAIIAALGLSNVVNTLFWPTALLLLTRYRRSRLDDSRSAAVATTHAPDP